MTMRRLTVLKHLAWTVVVLTAGVILCGCPASDSRQAVTEPEPSVDDKIEVEIPKPSTEPEAPAPTVEPADEPADEPVAAEADTGSDLGPPLVENPENLEKLDPEKPVWIDQTVGRVVMVGQVCQTNVPLEMFACLRDTKEHESIVAVDVKAFVVHAGLLAIGADPGHPVKFDPEYAPAAGSEIEVTLHWKDQDGKVQTARAQDWIIDTKTQKPMAHRWVFAGSGFWEDEQTGRKYYQAEGGDLICVSNFSTAMLDLPIESSQANDALMFMADPKAVPPRGTPVTLVLTVGKVQ